MNATVFSFVLGILAGIAVIGLASWVVAMAYDAVDSLLLSIGAGLVTAFVLLYGLTLIVPLP